jgi:hypothetical protein
MGTLFNQKPREAFRYNLSDQVIIMKQIAADQQVSLAEVIAIHHTLELHRRNQLLLQAGDIHDEQLAGFGEILQGIQDAILAISERQNGESK